MASSAWGQPMRNCTTLPSQTAKALLVKKEKVSRHSIFIARYGSVFHSSWNTTRVWQATEKARPEVPEEDFKIQSTPGKWERDFQSLDFGKRWFTFCAEKLLSGTR
jgi:hypothetical protein